MTKIKKIEQFSCGIYENRFSTLGIILIILGIYYLGTNFGWWIELPFWPILLITIGLYLIVKKISYRRIL